MHSLRRWHAHCPPGPVRWKTASRPSYLRPASSAFSTSPRFSSSPSSPTSSPRPLTFLTSPSTSTSATTPRRHPSSISSPSCPRARPYSSTSPPAMADERPTGLKATSGIELLTLNTPNGFKASILLEELKEAYGIEYAWQSIDISKGIQKEPWFTALNPNGRIPVIVDHDRNKLAVFEGIAILNYLARRFDTDYKFSFNPVTESDQVAIAESWIAWQHGGVGPMQGQANHFVHFAADKQDFYAAQRYVGETERLYGVLNTRLADRDFVAGPGRGRYSIADISLLGWAQALQFSGVDTSLFPHVFAWIDRCTARPATARGLAIPKPAFYANPDAELLEKLKPRLDFVQEAKKKFDYKFQTP